MEQVGTERAGKGPHIDLLVFKYTGVHVYVCTSDTLPLEYQSFLHSGQDMLHQSTNNKIVRFVPPSPLSSRSWSPRNE